MALSVASWLLCATCKASLVSPCKCCYIIIHNIVILIIKGRHICSAFVIVHVAILHPIVERDGRMGGGKLIIIECNLHCRGYTVIGRSANQEGVCQCVCVGVVCVCVCVLAHVIGAGYVITGYMYMYYMYHVSIVLMHL